MPLLCEPLDWLAVLVEWGDLEVDWVKRLFDLETKKKLHDKFSFNL